MMAVIGACFDWIRRQVNRNNPERLWIHYTCALFLIMGLLVATHEVNKRIIEHGSIAANALRAANATIIADNAILVAADQYALGVADAQAALETAIAGLAQIQKTLPDIGLWSPELQAHFFSDSTGLVGDAERYLALATELATRPAHSRKAALNTLRGFHTDADMTARQQETLHLLELTAVDQGQRLEDIQQAILTVSALVLLAEAIFIFAPAQMTVRASIAELRQKTEVMRKSRSQLVEMNKKLEYLVNHDALTGLPNRGSVVRHLNQVVHAHPAPDIGVLFVGLDDFKALNDAAGHDSGDQVLKSVATRFQSCIDTEDMVARVAGDEFVLVTFEAPSTLAKRVTSALTEPFNVGGRKLHVNASIGYLQSSDGSADALSLIADAGVALQIAKVAGGNRTLEFRPSLRVDMETLQKLQLELPDAIATGQIEPWFQPQIRLSDGMMHGAEVLARWRHPSHGLLSPDKFLPAAVRAGLMIDLDFAIWQAAMKNLQNWQSEGINIPHISLNAAPETISDPHLMERFLLLLHLNGLCPEQIIIEVLETTVIDGKDDMASINIDSLAECGVALELDDFGTGYASLSKLTQLPLAGIKLDRSLISPLPEAAADSVIRAILALAVELDLQVVAEGIEQQDQARSLNAHGCAVGQGFGFARPMSAKDFRVWLREYAAPTIGKDAGHPPIFTWA
ncbi:putative bifunctional diguanylate cyclase/phosphodiesterase [Yoonia sp.]|uniref:putative bifunctional diguanylate cyclase/phosphodiesterase n=1 Tax=Yoonia sp. TaxID=2212373 RepID=UPI003F6AD8B0